MVLDRADGIALSGKWISIEGGIAQMRMKRAIATVLVTSIVGVLTAITVSFAVPRSYRSHTVMFESPADESTRQMLKGMERDVFSPEALTAIIRKYNLYSRERARAPLNEVVEKMKRNISAYSELSTMPREQALMFYLDFDYPDGRLAQTVSGDLASAYMEFANRTVPHLTLDNWQYTLVVLDAPTLPLKPIAPNRARFATTGLLAGCICGLGIALVSSRRSTVSG
jgi:capsular polysaccharide biosynthesis protein